MYVTWLLFTVAAQYTTLMHDVMIAGPRITQRATSGFWGMWYQAALGKYSSWCPLLALASVYSLLGPSIQSVIGPGQYLHHLEITSYTLPWQKEALCSTLLASTDQWEWSDFGSDIKRGVHTYRLLFIYWSQHNWPSGSCFCWSREEDINALQVLVCVYDWWRLEGAQ